MDNRNNYNYRPFYWPSSSLERERTTMEGFLSAYLNAASIINNSHLSRNNIRETNSSSTRGFHHNFRDIIDEYVDYLSNQRAFLKHYYKPDIHTIHLAVLENNLTLVKELVQKHPGLIHEVDPNGQTALKLALAKGYFSIADYLKSKVSFVDLYPELILKIFSKLPPEQVAKKIFLLNKKYNTLAKENLFWFDIFKRQFPHVLPTLLTKFKNALYTKKTSDINWQDEFLKTYNAEYSLNKPNAKLSQTIRHWFSIIKNSDIKNCYDAQGKPRPISIALLDEFDINGKSLLEWAQDKNDQSILDYLYLEIKKVYIVDNKINTTLTFNMRTILYWAIELHQSQNEIISLLRNGSYLKEKYLDDKFFPIHIAAKQGRLDLVMLIIENHPEFLNALDAHGQTPLIHAVKNNHFDVVQYLLTQRKIDIEASSQDLAFIDNDKTALHWAAECADSHIGILLLKAGASDTTISTDNDFLPIHIAAETGKVDLLHALLLNRPGTINSPDKFFQTPLIWAASKGHLEVVQYLLSKKETIDLNAKTHGHEDNTANGKTALHYAAENGYDEVVIALLKANADATTLTAGPQYTALHLACLKNQFAVIRAFIHYQPVLFYRSNYQGLTPLDLLSIADEHVISEQIKNSMKNKSDANKDDNEAKEVNGNKNENNNKINDTNLKLALNSPFVMFQRGEGPPNHLVPDVNTNPGTSYDDHPEFKARR